MDFHQARQNMVDGQLRTNKVTDSGLISALRRIPREKFVAREQQPIAYVDEDLPLKFGQATRYMMEPMILGRLLQASELKSDDVVLEIGSLTGYATAVLAALCSKVYALESNAYAVNRAEETLRELEIYNVTCLRGDMTKGHPQKAPYDLIFINGAVEEVPPHLFEQLAVNGRLIAVVEELGGKDTIRAVGKAVLYKKIGSTVSSRVLFDAQVQHLPDFQKKKAFRF